MSWWEYDNFPSIHHNARGDWSPAVRGDRPWDQLDFHLDLGAGRVPKGRIAVDLRPTPGITNLAIDLDYLSPSAMRGHHTLEQLQIIEATDRRYQEWRQWFEAEHGETPPIGLPFPDRSIKSIVTHHCFEHVGHFFEELMEECYRILEWGGVMRIIVPLFPSYTAVSEYDHERYFTEGTFMGFCAEPTGEAYTDGFSEPYNTCCFRQVDEDLSPPTPPEFQWTKQDAREMRVTLWKHRPGDPDPEPEEYL